MEEIKKVFKSNIRQYTMLIALVGIMIFFQVLTNGVLLLPQNLANLIQQNSYVIILAIGMMLCILTGGNIDLSVGSVCALVGAITGVLIVSNGMNIYMAAIIAIGIGALVGVWQGFWIAYIRIPSFIVTLAGMLLFRGLTLIILSGQTISPYPAEFLKFSGGFIPDIIANGEIHILTILIGLAISVIYVIIELRENSKRQKYGFENTSKKLMFLKIISVLLVLNLFCFWLARYKGIPSVLIILAILILIYSFVTRNTTVGRFIYATGGNEKAAKLSGIKVDKVLFWVYVNMGVLAAIAGLVFTARLNAASPQAGTSFELDAIAACYIGGASASGGIGTITGAVIGALVMGVLNNGMSIMGIGIDWQMGIKGLVLLLAVAFDVISKKKAK